MRWLVCFAGLMFLGGGAALLIGSLNSFDEMRTAFHTYPATSTGRSTGGTAMAGGFMPGAGAMFAMLFIGTGLGVLLASIAPPPAAGRVASACLAVLWFGVAWHSGTSYIELAPERDAWACLLTVVFALLGLIPAGLALPRSGWAAPLRSGMLRAAGGAVPGAVAGALAGGVAGGVASMVAASTGARLVGGAWWAYGSAAGAIAAALFIGLFGRAWVTTGPPTKARLTREDGPAGVRADNSWACRACGGSITPDLSRCPSCHAPTRRARAVGPGLEVAGIVMFAVGFALPVIEGLLGMLGSGYREAIRDLTGGAGLGWVSFPLCVAGIITAGIGKMLKG
jgi:hypothetical protein